MKESLVTTLDISFPPQTPLAFPYSFGSVEREHSPFQDVVATLEESLRQIQSEEVDRYAKRHKEHTPILLSGTDSFRERIFQVMCEGIQKMMTASEDQELELLKPLLDYQGTIEQYRNAKKKSR